MTTPLQICTSYLESFATGDVDLVVSHVASDFVNEHTSALGSSCKGKDEYRSRLPSFISSMPKLSYAIEQIMSEGHHVWAAYTLRTTVNKHDIAIRGAMHFEVSDGLIVRRVDYWDSQVFKNQAGLA
jgi:steroid delta-isomerase-like uncharacterized protein